MKIKKKEKKQTSNIITLSFFFLLAAACLLSGCGASSEDTVSLPESQSETSDSLAGKKEIVIGSGTSCTSLDPIQNYDGWFTVAFGVGETLTKINDDGSVSGWLASDYSVSDDNTVWMFTIRDDVVFSDGTKLTADLAASSIQNVFENGTRGEEYFTCADLAAKGQTLTITTAEPEPILPAKLADPLFTIINTETDMTDIARTGPVATGPFIAESFDPTTEETVVVRNENYWDGDVALDQITFRCLEDTSILTMGLLAGDLNAVYNVSMTDIDDFEDNDDYNVIRFAGGRTTHGFMNQNGPLGDAVLRQAILRCLDRDSFCENLLNDQYVPGKTPITSSADYGYEELIDPNAYDPDSAAALLDEAGYLDIDGDGFRETPDGEEIDLTYIYYTGRPEMELLVEATQMECAKIGIRITPQLYDTETVTERLETGDYDLCCYSINVLSSGDPEEYFRTYFSSEGFYNAYGYSSAAFDSVLNSLSLTSDAEQRTELVKDAEQILMDDAVCIYYCYPIMNFVSQADVTGLTCTLADYYWVSAATDRSQN